MAQSSGGGGGLPAEYQEVEYIKQTSSGGQYIIFDFSLNPLTDYLELEQDYTTDYGGIKISFGYCTPYGRSVRNALYSVGSSGFWIADDSQAYTITASGFRKTPKIFKCSNNSLEIDGVIYATPFAFTNTPEYKFIWGALNEAGIAKYPYANLYFIELKCARNGVDLCHALPCYRKSDNVAGMYDVVNDVFYTNSGTGSFEIGPDVN